MISKKDLIERVIEQSAKDYHFSCTDEERYKITYYLYEIAHAMEYFNYKVEKIIDKYERRLEELGSKKLSEKDYNNIKVMINKYGYIFK